VLFSGFLDFVKFLRYSILEFSKNAGKKKENPAARRG